MESTKAQSLQQHGGDTGRSLQRLAPPVLVTALLWVGVQVLLLLYLANLAGVWAERLSPTFLTDVLAPASRVVLWVNLLFVVLLWLKHRSQDWSSPRERGLAVLLYAGASALLALVQWIWMTL